MSCIKTLELGFGRVYEKDPYYVLEMKSLACVCLSDQTLV